MSDVSWKSLGEAFETIEWIKLIACPFCGNGKLQLHEELRAAKPAAVTCQCGISTPRFERLEEAINWWNTRVER